MDGCSQQLERRVLIFHNREQEISEALAGQMSNEDEDEVEDELERMEMEANALPKVPSQPLVHEVVPPVKDDLVAQRTMPDVPTSMTFEDTGKLQRQKERAKARKVALHV